MSQRFYSCYKHFCGDSCRSYNLRRQQGSKLLERNGTRVSQQPKEERPVVVAWQHRRDVRHHQLRCNQSNYKYWRLMTFLKFHSALCTIKNLIDFVYFFSFISFEDFMCKMCSKNCTLSIWIIWNIRLRRVIIIYLTVTISFAESEHSFIVGPRLLHHRQWFVRRDSHRLFPDDIKPLMDVWWCHAASCSLNRSQFVSKFHVCSSVGRASSCKLQLLSCRPASSKHLRDRQD